MSSTCSQTIYCSVHPIGLTGAGLTGLTKAGLTGLTGVRRSVGRVRRFVERTHAQGRFVERFGISLTVLCSVHPVGMQGRAPRYLKDPVPSPLRRTVR
jgi:hypothetical protein